MDKPSCSGVKCEGVSRENSVVNSDEEDIMVLTKKIDESLENKAQQHNLSAINVKSILKHMIKYPSVISMLLGVNDESHLSSDLKLTRARTQQLVKNGKFDWPSTPLKEPIVRARTFLDVEYGEEEDDEDYDPRKESVNDSEHEDEHAQTTQSTVATRSKVTLDGVAVEELDAQLTLVDPDIQLPDEIITDSTPCNQLYYQFLSTLNTDEINTSMNDDASDPEYNFQEDEDNPETPCDSWDVDELRMDRSVRVTKREVHDLMSDLADIWTGNIDSPILQSSQTSPINNNTTQNDKKTSVAACQTENNELANVLLLANVGGFNQQILAQALHAVDHFGSDRILNNDGTTRHFVLSHKESLLLQQQMRMHVQLLLQSFISSRPEDDKFEHVTRDSANMIEELNSFRWEFSESHVPGVSSNFDVENLSPAVELVRGPKPNIKVFDDDVKGMSICAHKRKLGLLTRPLRRSVCTLLATSAALLYPHLLPLSGPQKRMKTGPTKPIFTQSEDFLISMGYLQFYPHSHYAVLIHNNLLPIKTPQQIMTRWRSQRSTKFANNNTIKYLRETNSLPDTARNIIDFSQILPIQWPANVCPPWLERLQLRGLDCVTQPGMLNRSPGQKWVKNIKGHGHAKYIRLDRGNKSLARQVLTKNSIKKCNGKGMHVQPEILASSVVTALQSVPKVEEVEDCVFDAQEDVVLDSVDNGDIEDVTECYVNSPSPSNITSKQANVGNSPTGENEKTSGVTELSDSPHKSTKVQSDEVGEFLEAVQLLSSSVRMNPLETGAKPGQKTPQKSPTMPTSLSKQKSPKNKAMQFLMEQKHQYEPLQPRIQMKTHNEHTSTASSAVLSDVITEDSSQEGSAGKKKKKRITRNRAQKEKEALANVFRPTSPKSMHGLCSQYVKDVKTGLFMHESKSDEFCSLLTNLQQHQPPSQVYERLSTVLLSAPQPKPMLVRLMCMFLSNADCLRINADTFIYNYRTACSVLVKLERYLNTCRSRAASRHMLRSMKRLGTLQSPQLLMQFLHKEFATSDPELFSQLQVLFPTAECDHRLIKDECFETLRIPGEDVDSCVENDHFETLTLPPSALPNNHIKIKICRDGRVFIPGAGGKLVYGTLQLTPEKGSEVTSCDDVIGRDIARDDHDPSLITAAHLVNKPQLSEMMEYVREMEEGEGERDVLRQVLVDVFGNSRMSLHGETSAHSDIASTVFLKGSQAKGLMLNEKQASGSKVLESAIAWTENEDMDLLDILYDECRGKFADAVDLASHRLSNRSRVEIFQRLTMHVQKFTPDCSQSSHNPI